MYFQTLDAKNECLGYYANSELHFEEIPRAADRTWYYSPALHGKQIEYARIYSGGKTLAEACPENLKSQWGKVINKLQAFFKSFRTSKIKLHENCTFELIPEFFLYELSSVKNEITKHVFENNERPDNHDFLVSVIEMLEDIKHQPLNVNIENILPKLVNQRGKNFHHRIRNARWVCDYNPFGTVTGRLTTMEGTFPILTMNREYRACLEPQNDWILELDYNAAEVRTLLGLSGIPQPKEDIHEWNIANIYDGKLSRPEAKQRIFEWLYSHRSDPKTEVYYNRELVKQKHWDGQNVQTIFGRQIKEVDNHHALNYIVQSTTSDLVLNRAVEVHKLLRDKESKIAFMMHDSIIIDLTHDERHAITEMMKIFSDTPFGEYRVNVALGKNFGEMKELNL